jgi:hypothetical protein
MTDQPIIAQPFVTTGAYTPSQLAAIPPGFLMWAGIYTAMFYVCGGMIAAFYDPRSR